MTSTSFTPSSTGTWCFAAVYSGDSSYSGSSDQSSDECYDVGASSSSTSTTPTNSTIVLGGSNTDGATVTGSDGADPTGTVSFYACGVNVNPCTPSGTPFDVETLSGTANPSSVTSTSFTPSSTGTWCFAAVYSGDSSYSGSSDQSSDECYTVTVAASSTSTTPTNSTIVLGGSNTDGATVIGTVGGVDPTGTVSFYACGAEREPVHTQRDPLRRGDPERDGQPVVGDLDFLHPELHRHLVLRRRLLGGLQLLGQLRPEQRRVLHGHRHSPGSDDPADEPVLQLGAIAHLHRSSHRQPDSHPAVAVLGEWWELVGEPLGEPHRPRSPSDR